MEKKIMFWMDTRIGEIEEFLINWKISINHMNGAEVFENFYQESLLKRFKKSKNSILLNYRLFLKKIGLIEKQLNPTETLKTIMDLMKSGETINLSDIIHYLILINGEYLQLLKDINDIQKSQKFFIKGTKSELLKEIKQFRRDLNLKDKDYQHDKENILPKFENGGDEWFRIVVSELFKKGYYKSLSSLLEAISRRFANNYFHDSLNTNFLLKRDFQPPVGYKINWTYINRIISKYDNIFKLEKFIIDD